MRRLARNLRGALRRVFPRCVTQAQAAAFNMFLAFFPWLLVVLGVLSGSQRLEAALGELFVRLKLILPPGSHQMVVDYLVGHGHDPWKLILVGLAGTLLIGSQVMTNLMDGFRLVHGDAQTPGFWGQQWRALALISVTLGPLIVFAVVTVFGRQVRHWMIEHFGLPWFFRGVWTVVYVSLALVLAIVVLAVIYRVGRSGRRTWSQVIPGAIVATALWWAVSSAFGVYVTHMPYSVVYRGLAAAIGLMVWMYLSAVVVLLGAAYNAEALARRETTARKAQGVAPASQSQDGNR